MKNNCLKGKKTPNIILRKKLEERTALICHQNCQFDAQRESKCFSAAIMTLNIISLNLSTAFLKHCPLVPCCREKENKINNV